MTSFPVSAVAALLALANLASAQTASAISGTVTNAAGAAVASATVTARNVAAGQSVQVRSDAAGRYSVPNLAQGDYDVTAAAARLTPKTVRVTLGAVCERH